jgi:hypothetical protein
MKIKGASGTVQDILSVLNISQDFSGGGYYFFYRKEKDGGELIHIQNGVQLVINDGVIRVYEKDNFKIVFSASQLEDVGFLDRSLFNNQTKGEK